MPVSSVRSLARSRVDGQECPSYDSELSRINAMSARFLIIDGYNLLYAAGMGKASYGPRDLERCRHRLLNFLGDKLTAAEQARATVIFDARHPPPDAPRLQMHGPLRVFFATPHGDADLFIEDLLVSHSAPKQVTLVSSDHRLQAVARRRKAKPIDSEAFFDELDRRRSKAEPPVSRRSRESDRKQTGGLSDAELAHWLNVFGGIDTAKTAEPAATEPPLASDRAEHPHQPITAARTEPKSASKPRKSGPGSGRGTTARAKRNQPRGKSTDVTDAEITAWRSELERWLKELGKP